MKMNGTQMLPKQYSPKTTMGNNFLDEKQIVSALNLNLKLSHFKQIIVTMEKT